MLNCPRSVLFLLFMAMSLAGCNSGGGGASRLVTVNGQSGGIPNATVVLGDRNGTMITSGTTDANGQITFANAPADATVTAATSCLSSGLTTTQYFLNVKYDVNEPVVVNLQDFCPEFIAAGPSADPSIGVVIINVTNSLSGVTQNEILTKPPLDGNPTLITQQTVSIDTYDLQPDGKLSLIVVGKDDSGKPIGYGAALDQTFIDGMTVDITVDQSMGFVQYQLANISTTATYLCSGILQTRTGKKSYWMQDCSAVPPFASEMTVDVPYMTGIGDQYNYEIDLYHDPINGGNSHSMQYMGVSSPVGAEPSNQNFDLSQALTIPTNLSVSGANTATPTFSWTGVDPTATTFYVWADMRLSSVPYYYFEIDNIALTRTSITFPELPDSLAALRPIGIDRFGVQTSSSVGNIQKGGAGWYYNNPSAAPGMLMSQRRVKKR